MKNILITLKILFLFACSGNRYKVNEVYYVIKHHTTPLQEKRDIPPPLPITYYGNFNIILLDSTTIYFHSQHIYRFFGTGIDNRKPPRVFLTPESLTKINIAQLPYFLATTINDSSLEDRHFFASISSPTDTIRNRAFKTITDFFKSKIIIRYNTRQWTEEEQYVTKAKIENKKYNPHSINWTVGFDIITNAE